jgi:DNA-binding response OmpR family regulator
VDRLRVLVIDDERTILDSLALAIEMTDGFEVSTLQDVTQWRERILSFKPEIILVDYRMPAMNGDAFIEILNATVLRSAIKCLGMFSATPFSPSDLQRIGADIFFEKPFEIENILFQLKAIARRTSDKI